MGLHDKLSSDAGYERNSHLEVLDFQASYYPGDERLVFTRATFLDLLSLDVLSPIARPMSYHFYAGFEPGLNASPQEANELAVRGGVGIAVAWRRNVIYGMALAAGGVNKDADRGYYFGPGAELGWVATLAPRLKFAYTGLLIQPLAPMVRMRRLSRGLWHGILNCV
jgi:hypothetical protein